MASNKDILEAQRYNRRRLITSFVAGSPEGKEVEPQAPTRPFVIGAALAVVMLLVSVGLRFLYPGADTKQSAGLAVVSSSKTDSGTRSPTGPRRASSATPPPAP